MAILSSRLKALLEDQFKHEKHNELRYLARSSWADNNGLNNTSSFFAKEASGEAGHAATILKYLNDRNVQAILSPSDYSDGCPDVFSDVFTTALEIERTTTEMLKNIANVALSEGDWQTVYWVSTLILEQTEEENLYVTILDRMAITQDVHLLDIWIGSLA